MNEPVDSNPYMLRNSVLKLQLESQQAELIRVHCEVMLQRSIWGRQQQQLQQDNQLLLFSLIQAGVLNVTTLARLQQLTQDSQCDALTQTLNRTTMLDRISQAISMAKRQQHGFALLFLDLNNFKPINDQYGHAAGDAVLQQVSARLQAAIRDSDAVSRHGGDEFLLLLNNIKHAKDAGLFAAKLAVQLAQPYQLEQGVVSLSASIGIACYPADADTAKALICHADAAMYRAKRQSQADVA
ncbi:GGDEF domain-containing protein [Rheinheimera maricola]|uniref:GGDEF domain-containing protein n=1 Tax=Rheinheimera maricola TaxID=2793282 RepID=A0ABS7XCP7_9GAMM|nr:GGDEF domain-containing protein [Rheinheimera maricola]MBZ9613330.1 GGDEF domain-containing protein [Rheinheimera maricola]